MFGIYRDEQTRTTLQKETTMGGKNEEVEGGASDIFSGRFVPDISLPATTSS